MMLVDLGRNDLGRVSKPGTVRVSRAHGDRALFARHAPGLKRGRAAARRYAAVDALRSCFPAGTVSGRQRSARWRSSPSWSAISVAPTPAPTGFFGFNGDVEVAITIRTMVIKDGLAHVQAGGGIVADSDPTRGVPGDAPQGSCGTHRRGRGCPGPNP